MESVPTILCWSLRQLCSCSSCDQIIISDINLKRIVRTALNDQSLCSEGPLSNKVVDAFLQNQARAFCADNEPMSLPSGSTAVHYNAHVVPVLLAEFGVVMSMDTWDRVFASIREEVWNRKDMTTKGHDDFTFMSSPSTPNASVYSDGDSTMFSQEAPSQTSTATAGSSLWFDCLSRDELLQKLNERDRIIEELRATSRNNGPDDETTGRRCRRGMCAATKLARLRATLQQKERDCKKLTRQNLKLQADTEKKSKDLARLQSLQIERNGKRAKKKNHDGSEVEIGDRGWFLPTGICRVAIKRNLAHCASEQLQLLIEQDISRWTVSRHLVLELLCFVDVSSPFNSRCRTAIATTVTAVTIAVSKKYCKLCLETWGYRYWAEMQQRYTYVYFKLIKVSMCGL